MHKLGILHISWSNKLVTEWEENNNPLIFVYYQRIICVLLFIVLVGNFT